MHIEDAPPVKSEGERPPLLKARGKVRRLNSGGAELKWRVYLIYGFCARLHVPINAVTFAQKLQISFSSKREETTSHIVHHAP